MTLLAQRRGMIASRRSGEQWLRTARLSSGLVLMIFVVLHFANHMLALISLDAAEAGRQWFMMLWRNPVGTVVFYGALLVHVTLVMFALYRRRTLIMPWREALQVGLGLLIPLLIAQHVIGTRIFSELSGVDDTYEFVVNSLWVWSPSKGLQQAIAVVAIWVHGCLGLYFWLRYRPWFAEAGPVLIIVAALVPVLTLLGFVNAGRTVQYVLFTGTSGIDPALLNSAEALRDLTIEFAYAVYAAIIVLVLFLRMVRTYRERRSVVEIRYASGQRVRVPRGYTVLEASRLGGIPHNAVCGGRGRCSTCRVRVLEGLDALPPLGPIEKSTLTRIHAEPDVRLACQLHPDEDIKVAPMLAVDRNFGIFGPGVVPTPGREQEVAILFCDLRSFTAISDHKLPFDTVFLLNRYFALVGRAVEGAGGRLDKFIGDGAMAIFGLNSSREEACRQALVASSAIIRELQRVSDELSAELGQPLRIAIGIHSGAAIVGTMGYGKTMGVTAIGDTVNIASRLESVAKEFNAAIVISETAADLSGLDMTGYETRDIDIRGRAKPLKVRIVPADAPPDASTVKLSRAPAEPVT
ncbi:MAG: adenylate/guanylate cyclase domain-containing protein [Rhizobiaceae bacterium]|nr:adenylate/guanylate cyclase domain-containing protein [Rhizobiaceae bacterium]